MTNVDSRRRALLCLLAALAGIALTLVCFYPGYMSNDSVMQLMEARSGEFTDAHPPIMAALWRILDRVLPGPQGMLVFHSAMLWTGAALLCRLVIRGPYLAAVTVLLIGLFPPVFAQISTIWKDVGLATALLLAFSLMLHAYSTGSKRSLLGSGIPMLYALAVRHNG